MTLVEQNMRAAVVVNDGSGGKLEIARIPAPELRPGTIRIAVKTAAVNHADLAKRAGRYNQKATQQGQSAVVPGIEIAGVVTEVAADVSGRRVGDEVMAMCAGGYAEQVVVDHRLAFGKPSNIDWKHAAAVPLAYATAHNALTAAGKMTPGSSVLITGGGGVVGFATAQMARRLGAGRIVAITGDSASADRLTKVGVTDVVDHSVASFLEDLQKLEDVDVVVDMIAGSWFPHLLDTMAIRGRIVTVGRLLDRNVSFNLDTVSLKRLEIIGVTFRTRTLDEYADVVMQAADAIAEPLERDELVLPAVRSFRFEDADNAQLFLASGGIKGKIVLEMS